MKGLDVSFLAMPAMPTRSAQPWLAPAAKRATRLWAGHPEGFIDAFANIYTDIAEAVLARRDGVAADELAYTFPTVQDGVLGVQFVEAAVASDRQDGRWVKAAVA